MNKKINSMIITLLMLFAIPAVAYSQEEIVAVTYTQEDLNEESNQIENEIVENISQREVRDIITNNGAKVRVMQLERSIKANFLGAVNIIFRLNELEKENVDYEKLNSIVDSLQSILIELENFDYDKSQEDMAKEFVMHKSDAIELTKEFRTHINTIISENEREELKELQEKRREQVETEFREKVNQEIKKQNIAHLNSLMNKHNLNTTNIISKIESGEITSEQVRERLSQMSKEIPLSNRAQVVEKFVEEKIRDDAKIRENSQEIRENLRLRAENRDEILKERLEQNRIQISNRIKERLEYIENKSEDIDIRIRN